ncbi:MAG: TrmH family RNA methyltransferase [Geminicoccaceae bacterium]
MSLDQSPELIARFRSARRDPALVVLEGFHALKHALRFGAAVIVAVTPDAGSLLDLADRLAPDLAAPLTSLLREVDAATFVALAPVAPATGVLALAHRPQPDVESLLANAGGAPLVLLENPGDLGNIGAAIRVAAAAGAAGVLTTGRNDPWHATAVRGGAGLQFALPVARIERLDATTRPLVAVDPSGTPLTSGGLAPGALCLFGSERTGLGPVLLARATQRVAIPMRPGVSSLNLATAVAAALYVGMVRSGA